MGVALPQQSDASASGRAGRLPLRLHTEEGRTASLVKHAGRTLSRPVASIPRSVPLPITAAEVFENHASQIFSLAWRLLSNYADAEDVTQDVLLSVVRKLGDFRGRADLKTWLHRVTVNAALLHRRRSLKQKLRTMSESLEQLAPSTRRSESTPDKIAVQRETHRLIDEAISRLPEIYRDVFVLSDVEGWPNSEIGALLELTLAAVKSRLHRARLLLRAALASHLEVIGADDLPQVEAVAR